ncbi:MAG: dihydropteroate synthase [uncultured bacterium]|nr:MAG: dihydropteroate synthase [uncultured bacterium]
MCAQIMGILNVTPDSFFDGGQFLDNESAYQQAKKLLHEGADIIDIGGESTRPGAKPVSCEEEITRIVNVVSRLSKEISNPISVDTTKSKVASLAIKAGASIINDVSGFIQDDQMIPLLRDCPHVKMVVMHSRGTPENMSSLSHYDDVTAEVIDELQKRVEFIVSNGISANRLIIDPGFGFAKNHEQNTQLLNNIAEFKKLGIPILAGVSRKSFLGHIAKSGSPKDRLPITLAAHFWLFINNIDILRVHDVKETKQVLDLYRVLHQN